MKSCLIQHGHPEEILHYTMAQLFSPSSKSQNELTDYITFAQTHICNTKFKKNINNSLYDCQHNSLKNEFRIKEATTSYETCKTFTKSAF